MSELQIIVYAQYHMDNADYQIDAILGNLQSPETPFRPVTITHKSLKLNFPIPADTAVEVQIAEVYYIDSIYAIPQKVKIGGITVLISDDGKTLSTSEANLSLGSDTITRPSGQLQCIDESGIAYYLLGN